MIKFSKRRFFLIAKLIIGISLLYGCFLDNKNIIGKTKPFMKARLHLVEKIGDNYLFRGTGPFTERENPQFAYEAVKEAMQEEAKVKGHNIGNDFYLVDISLLHFELKDIGVEKTFFKKNPKLGEFVNWSILGIFPASSNMLDKLFRKGKLYSDSIFDIRDRLPKRISDLNNMMTKKYDKPRIFYVHCEAGCDRTGEVIASYRMFNPRMRDTFEKVNDLNRQECGRVPNKVSNNAIAWFCNYLKDKGYKNAQHCSFGS